MKFGMKLELKLGKDVGYFLSRKNSMSRDIAEFRAGEAAGRQIVKDKNKGIIEFITR